MSKQQQPNQNQEGPRKANTKGKFGLLPPVRRPNGLDVYAVRPPDPETGGQDLRIHSAAGGADMSLMTGPRHDGTGSNILAFGTDTRVIAHRQMTKMQGSALNLSSALHETLEVLPIDSHVRLVAELPEEAFLNAGLLGLVRPDPPAAGMMDPSVPTIWLNELGNQVLCAPKQFVAITDEGAILISRTTPVHILLGHLKEPHVTVPPIRDFVQQYVFISCFHAMFLFYTDKSRGKKNIL